MNKKNLLLQFDILEYGDAYNLQKQMLEARISGKIEDCLIMLQHPPTFTYGRRYRDSNLITNKECYSKNNFAVYKTDRGGLATYHCPWQVVCYPILKMSTYTKEFHKYLWMLEEVVVRTLSGYGVEATRREGYTGVWVNDAKIGFIGVRIVMGYAMHGFSVNVNNDLRPFNLITPCGIDGVRVTSIKEILNAEVSMKDAYNKLANNYSEVFQVQMVPISAFNGREKDVIMPYNKHCTVAHVTSDYETKLA